MRAAAIRDDSGEAITVGPATTLIGGDFSPVAEEGNASDAIELA
jgi:hypothetical protein